MSPERISPLLVTKDNHSNLKSSLFDSSLSTYVVEKSEFVLHLKDFDEESHIQYQANGLEALCDSNKIDRDYNGNSKKSSGNTDGKINETEENTKHFTTNDPESSSGLPNKPLSPILQYHD